MKLRNKLQVLLKKEWTNPADIIKEVYDIPWQVKLWNIVSQIADNDEAIKNFAIYIKDAVDIITKAIYWDKKIVNLSSGKEHSIKEYAQIICDIVGYEYSLIEWDTAAFVGSPNKKLINNHLQQYSFTPLKEGLTETIKYYENRRCSSK
jgi:nucleoside-diphosphate-sugar epimerase